MNTVLNRTQEISSADTSIKTINGIYKKIVGKYPKYTTIFDYGCGRYDENMRFATENDFVWFGVDPYNRSVEWNKANINEMKTWGDSPNIIMLNNVLNVVKEKFAIEHIVRQVYNYAGENTDVYITIYEGDKSGIGRTTSKGYQRNEKVNNYIDYICEWFEVIEKIGNILKVRKVV